MAEMMNKRDVIEMIQKKLDHYQKTYKIATTRSTEMMIVCEAKIEATQDILDTLNSKKIRTFGRDKERKEQRNEQNGDV